MRYKIEAQLRECHKPKREIIQNLSNFLLSRSGIYRSTNPNICIRLETLNSIEVNDTVIDVHDDFESFETELYIAGNIIHIVRDRGDPVKNSSASINHSARFRVKNKNYTDFSDIVLSFYMGIDHFPNKMRDAFNTFESI